MVDSAVEVDDKRIVGPSSSTTVSSLNLGLTDLLGSAADIEIVGEAANAGKALQPLKGRLRW